MLGRRWNGSGVRVYLGVKSTEVGRPATWDGLLAWVSPCVDRESAYEYDDAGVTYMYRCSGSQA